MQQPAYDLESGSYAKTIMDSVSAHIAVIDRNGVILETNLAWKQFAKSNQVAVRPDMVGVNYLEVCAFGMNDPDEGDIDVSAGIRQVINGEIDEFVIDYPCHSPDEQRWFYMRAIRALGPGPLRVIISHENITPLKLAQKRLKEREAELNRSAARLEEANAALRAILRQLDEDKKELEEAVFLNIKQFVIPYLEDLKSARDPEERRELLELAESGLNKVTSPFLHRLSNLKAVLTPQEIQIASLVKEGKSTKDIAKLMNVSINTIKFHRRNLRDKLGLKNTAYNLRAHLLSLV